MVRRLPEPPSDERPFNEALSAERLSQDAVASRLVRADALDLAASLQPGSIDLIYVDPPFFSGREQRGTRHRGQADVSYADRWDGDLGAYLAWLEARLALLRPLLKPSGSLYVHLDWHAVHYVKVDLDRLFGYDNFLNEIVWLYGLGGSSVRYWPRKHDTLLWYAREVGRHHFEAVRVPATSQRMKGRTKKAPDHWDIPSLNNMAKERLGYPTQKPEALLERIILSSCPEGGVVADFFCGSGTALAVAERTGRRWVGCDLSADAIAVTHTRLEAMGAVFESVS